MDAVFPRAGQEAPQVVGGDRQDRGQQARQAVGHRVDRRLGRPPRPRPGGEGVEPVLGDVDVERAQVDGQEVVHGVRDRLELVALAGGQDRGGDLPVAGQGVAVHFFELGGRQAIDRRIEVEQVRHENPQRVADLAVRFDHAREDLVAQPHLLAVVDHGDPQAQYLGAVAPDDLPRVDAVADRLRHLAARRVDDEAVGQHLAEGRGAARAEADEQRAVEPAPVLVGTLQIERRRPLQVRPRTEHRLVARPRVEPDVEDVALALERPSAARRAGEVRRQELVETAFVPGVGAVLLEYGGRPLDERRRQRRLAAGTAVEGRDRHAPRPLARDAPVGPVRHHAADPLFAPGGEPLHAGDGVERPLPQRAAVERDEPLRGGEEDDRAVAAPAVRVGVLDVGPLPQPALLGESRLHARVGLEDAQPAEQLHIVREVAARPDRRVDVETVADARPEVVGPVAGGGMDGAGALIEGDVVGQHRHRVALVQRVPEPQALEVGSPQRRQRSSQRPAGFAFDAAGRRLGHEDRAGPSLRARRLVRRVGHLGMERDGQVRRDGPRRRGPDQDAGAAAGQRRRQRAERGAALGGQRKLDVDRRRPVRLVLHLGLGQRGPAPDAPVHRFLAAVDQILLDEAAEGAHDGRLVGVPHRQVRRAPVAEDAEPPEAGALHFDVALGVPPALAAHLADAHLALARAEFAVHAQFDGQAVAVPARHVRRVVAGHRARPDDEVLQNLVERGADVDVAVGVGRAVVQHVALRPAPPLADPAVQVHLLPAGDRVGLGGGQAGLHPKTGPRQVQGLFPVGHGEAPPA